MNNDFLNEINNLVELGESRLKFLNKMYHHFNIHIHQITLEDLH